MGKNTHWTEDDLQKFQSGKTARKTVKAKKAQPEYQLQKQVCQYLNTAYPKVLFLSDTVASIKLTGPQQVRNKAIQKSGFKCPDLLIMEPRKGYAGLLIELKTETPFRKDGQIKASANDHLKLQLEALKKLKAKGYFATFSWGFDMTKKIIDSYLKNNFEKNLTKK